MGQATPSLLPTTATASLGDNNLLKSLGKGDILNGIHPARQHRGGIIGVKGDDRLGYDGAVAGRACFVSGR